MTDYDFYQELVRRALVGTESMYGKTILDGMLHRRLKSSFTGSTFNCNNIKELREMIENAKWEPAPIEQSREISHGSIALVTHDFGGNLGIVNTDELPDDIKIDLKVLMHESKKLNAVIDGKNFDGPQVNFTTMVIEADKSEEDGHTELIMSTVCPGFLPAKPNEFGIFDAEYVGPRSGLTKDQIKQLGYKYVILDRI